MIKNRFYVDQLVKIERSSFDHRITSIKRNPEKDIDECFKLEYRAVPVYPNEVEPRSGYYSTVLYEHEMTALEPEVKIPSYEHYLLIKEQQEKNKQERNRKPEVGSNEYFQSLEDRIKQLEVLLNHGA